MIKEKMNVSVLSRDSKFNNRTVSMVSTKKSLTIKYILSLSMIVNLVLNIIYLAFICYSCYTEYLGFYFFLFSFVWTIISMIASYKLADDIGNNLFYFNVILVLFLSKMWFIYM